ncbi:MAG: SAM-dependent methyltransferase [Betaproteobacteria bacterium]|nr:SAM-dependent methyltransferase [Betaproteobacteria bacterium]
MELALYAPGLGYYSAGAHKLGAAGDFVTAPELSPLFGRTLARQVAEWIRHGLTDILELGAGSGALAAQLLAELEALGASPRSYSILEVSADLRRRAQELLAQRVPRRAGIARWLERLPESFSGLVLGNEVLDALPAHVVATRAGGIDELGVAVGAAGVPFAWVPGAPDAEVAAAAATLGLPAGYTTEINLAARALVRTVGGLLERGVILFIDYGFPAREYYHWQRCQGTLMCHYRHHAHADPFCLVGLQDITAHVDFTAVARAAEAAGLAVLGYATQAQFLVNCGITDILSQTPADNVRAYAPLAAQAQKLLSPSEMGELFKVIALGKNVAEPLLGFRSGDRSALL